MLLFLNNLTYCLIAQTYINKEALILASSVLRMPGHTLALPVKSSQLGCPEKYADNTSPFMSLAEFGKQDENGVDASNQCENNYETFKSVSI